MSQLSNEQVDVVARQVLEALGVSLSGNVRKVPDVPPLPVGDPSKAQPVPTVDPSGVQGIFPDVDSAVAAARKAHLALMEMSLEKREEIIASIRAKMLKYGEYLARKAQKETGLGRVEDKVLKNALVTTKTPGTEVLKPTAYTGDRGLTLIELAPYGVIGAITPVTNPTSSIICNTIGMVAAGNGIVFNPHPSAKSVCNENIVLINAAITAAGGPPNLVTGVGNPTIESAQELMKHPGIRLLVVTGGAGVVKAAMASGKRAVCAGPGNPPVVVDETADLDLAAEKIVFGASMDNNIICVDEKEVFVVESVADSLIQKMLNHKAVLVPKDKHRALENVIFLQQNGPRKPAVMNKEMIGKNAADILAKIGMHVDPGVRLAIMDVEEDHPLVWSEQMMPVLPVVRVKDVDRAIDLAKEAEHGFGHSAIMYSRNIDKLSRMAREINCSIFVKNGPAVAGLGYGGEGYCSFSIASPTGEGLSYSRTFARERRCVLVDHFRIV
ncbi:MAG: aldehyde dehydrogenase family protein [bacterium]